MRRRAPLLLRSGGAFVVLLAALMVVPALSTRTGEGPLALQAASTCADVLLIGADGNGERPRAGHHFGPTLDTVTRGYLSRLQPTRTVEVERVSGRTAPLTTLTRTARRHRPARPAIRVRAVRRWMASVDPAVRRTLPVVTAALRGCPEEQLVLVGYAQGAAVAHRLLLKLAKGGLLSRVTAAVLFSDPDKRVRTKAARDGDPVAPRSHQGIASLRLRGVPDVPRPRGSSTSWEVCARDDLVCDPSRTTLRRAVSVARSYAGNGHVDPALARVRSALVTSTRWWPVPTPRRRIVATTEGTPVRVQLSASTAAGVRDGLRWGPVGSLPTGLTLSASGLLSGTAPVGVHTLTYTVRGTSPSTPPRTGRVVVTVGGRTVSLSSGGQTSCETRSDGTAWCWGRNDYGQFGNGTTTGSASPKQVSGTGWTQVSTSGATTCGVKSDHTLYCWGLNDYAQTGRAASGPVTRPQRVGTSSRWRQVAVAWSHACGVRTNGELYCWGQNLRGQLGIGSTGSAKATPRRVGTDSTWASVTAGGWHTCATRTDGSAWCWGDNALGELGIGTTTRHSSPARVGTADDWQALTASWGGTCGLRGAGALYCWGKNRHGEVGDGTTTDRTSPVRVGSRSTWLDVSAGDGSTCALDDSGRPWCWGDNRYGQSAAVPPATDTTDTTGTTGTTGTATTVPEPTLRSNATGLTRISAGWLHYCAAAAAVTCWGSDDVGQLGTAGDSSSRQAPSVQPAPTIPASEQRRLDTMTPAEVAHHDLAARPEVPERVAATTAAARTSVRVMTYNVLGSNHTQPGADADEFAPARLRAEWSAGLITHTGAALVGTQEAQPDQIGDFDEALGGRYAIYPGTAQGYDATPQSLMFRDSAWTRVWQDSISIPFMSGWRPQPVVRLKNTASGAQLYLINVHFSPGSQQDDRQKAMDILVAEIKTLRKDGLPILLTGDFNEKSWVFCQITGRTDLRAAKGGSNDGTCEPPSGMRVDWIFGVGGSWSSYHLVDGAEVRRTTDHALQYATFTVG